MGSYSSDREWAFLPLLGKRHSLLKLQRKDGNSRLWWKGRITYIRLTVNSRGKRGGGPEEWGRGGSFSGLWGLFGA